MTPKLSPLEGVRLLPCPFCGTQPKESKLHDVWCDNDDCPIVGQVFSGGSRHWNGRVTADIAAPVAEQSTGAAEQVPVAEVVESASGCLNWLRPIPPDGSFLYASPPVSGKPASDAGVPDVSHWREIAEKRFREIKHAQAIIDRMSLEREGWITGSSGFRIVPKVPTDDMELYGMEASVFGRPSMDDPAYVLRIWNAMLDITPPLADRVIADSNQAGEDRAQEGFSAAPLPSQDKQEGM